MRLQQGITTGGMGSDCHFAQQQPSGLNVRFGSKADIAAPPTNVRFTPKSGHPIPHRRNVRVVFGAGPGDHPSHLTTTAEVLLRAGL